MDSLARYQQIIEQVLSERAQIPYAHGEIERVTVFDRDRDHYLLLAVGWDEYRVHGCVVHVDLIDGKFWIQRDETEDGIATDLLAAGVPKEHIVLAWRRSEIRKHTGFAVA